MKRPLITSPHAGGARQTPYVSLLLASFAVVIYFIPDATHWLQYERAAVARGEIWRLLTGHWTHAGFEHLFWDALMLAVLGALCEGIHRRAFVACVLGSAMAIALLLWVFLPEFEIYRGLSGIDSALFMLLAVTVLRAKLRAREWRWAAATVGFLLLFVAKTAFEFGTGATVFVDSAATGMTPVPLAHVAGMVVGVAVALALGRRRAARQPARSSRRSRTRLHASAIDSSAVAQNSSR